MDRQLSNCCAAFGYENSCRYRGSDAGDAPLLLELEDESAYGLS